MATKSKKHRHHGNINPYLGCDAYDFMTNRRKRESVKDEFVSLAMEYDLTTEYLALHDVTAKRAGVCFKDRRYE